ncbi:MAG: hypothetical protein AAFR71_10160 [Pseudomonadota bacterium]
MSVTLRVVGIYYYQSDIPYTSGMTVMDVLNYASTHPVDDGSLKAKTFSFETGTLNVGSEAGQPSITSFYADYEDAFQSRTSGLMRDAGPYYLAEDTSSSPAFTAWQYYVFTKPLQEGGAVYQVNDPRVESFVNSEVPDGGFVTWRLCKILGATQAMPPHKMSYVNKMIG